MANLANAMPVPVNHPFYSPAIEQERNDVSVAAVQPPYYVDPARNNTHSHAHPSGAHANSPPFHSPHHQPASEARQGYLNPGHHLPAGHGAGLVRDAAEYSPEQLRHPFALHPGADPYPRVQDPDHEGAHLQHRHMDQQRMAKNAHAGMQVGYTDTNQTLATLQSCTISDARSYSGII